MQSRGERVAIVDDERTVLTVTEEVLQRFGYATVSFDSTARCLKEFSRGETEFVLGSALRHPHDLVTGYYSVHTSPDALRDGEAHISSIQERLVQEGRL